MPDCRRIAQLKSAAEFRNYLQILRLDLPFEDALSAPELSPLNAPCQVNGQQIGNRWAILPMEGWDGTPDGRPTELTRRRWRRFGLSGAKLIWGGEAVAVRHDGRANPHQLLMHPSTVDDLASLRRELVAEHERCFGAAGDLMIGLQLTHSGRFSDPDEQSGRRPVLLYRHPLLDKRLDSPQRATILDDDAVARLVDDFVTAAVLARQAGFDFVDIKHCHGYLGHEFLTAVHRSGRYGGSFENRTRFLSQVVAGIRQAAPGLQIGVRLSAVDWLPFHPGPDGTGRPETWSGGAYPFAFGSDATGLGIDLAEPHRFLDLLAALDVRLVCVSLGSPYYNPHIQRPALFPPSDGYGPPEDPLAGVARHLAVTAELKSRHPTLTFVGSGYSYLQEWLPNVAQAAVRASLTDFVGLGRMALAYPQMPADVLAGRPLRRKQICRTFSDCTTAPRHGLPSGCYPLDEAYKNSPQATELATVRPSRNGTVALPVLGMPPATV